MQIAGNWPFSPFTSQAPLALNSCHRTDVQQQNSCLKASLSVIFLLMIRLLETSLWFLVCIHPFVCKIHQKDEVKRLLNSYCTWDKSGIYYSVEMPVFTHIWLTYMSVDNQDKTRGDLNQGEKAGKEEQETKENCCREALKLTSQLPAHICNPCWWGIAGVLEITTTYACEA